MWKYFIALFLILTAPAAQACSCICSYDEYVSDYVQDRHLFWGVPVSANLEKEQARPGGRPPGYLVRTEVTVMDGFGRLQSNSTFVVWSRPDDDASCGQQLKLGVPQFIIARGQDNQVSNCNCSPPLEILTRYLQTGEDVFLPDLDKCPVENSEDQKVSDSCKIWESGKNEYEFFRQEHLRIYERFRAEFVLDK